MDLGIGRQAYRHREAYNGTIYKSGVDLGILRGDRLTGAGCLQPAKSGVCPPDKFFGKFAFSITSFHTFWRHLESKTQIYCTSLLNVLEASSGALLVLS